MPRFYNYAGQPRQYNAAAYNMRTARAASSKSLGAHPGDLGKLRVRSYFGGQDLSNSNFGGQNKELGAMMLSSNEKRLVMIGVIGIAGWFFFGKQITKALKK
jgi:hypothetical protein